MSAMELRHRSILSNHLDARRLRIKLYLIFSGQEFLGMCKDTHVPVTLVKNVHLLEKIQNCHQESSYNGCAFLMVSVDIIGPLTWSDRGNQYIMTIIDSATRFQEVICLKRIDIISVAEGLMSMFSRVGIPDEIQSDQGSQFTSGMMNEYCRLLSVHQVINSPYHAMVNGAIERFNGTLKPMLKKLSVEKTIQWDRYIDPALFAYRSCIHRVTGFSPFELLYGRTVKGPMNILKQIMVQQ